MTKKCEKYEALLQFSDEATLMAHLEECEDCRAEHERMQRVSELIKEVKPLFNKKQKYTKLKVACLLFLTLVGGATLEITDANYGILDTIKYGEELTLEDLGFPVDDYGMIKVD